MNYGHPLEFGTFSTPASSTAEQVVNLALRGEELGFDLVTFQDHPYQPAHLDTWTLLSWVAARTNRVRLAANVHNLPLRAPAVLARSAGSLDLLSGGRFDLALGAGSFWRAIAAMGGPHRSPGAAVDALSEGIDIIRGILDAGDTTPLRLDGEHYRIGPAQRGPLPTQHVPIWLGAGRPRMLGLLGQKADGWVLSLGAGFGTPTDLRAGNELIDAAAVQAGREPSDIRRLINVRGQFAATSNGFLDGPPEQWVADLAPLVVRDGVGTIIVMTDDADTMQTFAREVAPALRDAVDHALLPPLRRTRPRSTAVTAQRRPGIDYEAVPAALAGAAVEPGDIDYSRVRSTYLRGGAPGLVLRPRNAAEVVEAVGFVRRHQHLPLGIRSGGHGISGRSTNDGGIVVDVGQLNTIEVLDESTRRVRIGPGARWKEVAAALAPYDWALSSGDYGGVGVGGLATAGGVGFLARKHGLTIDHLRAAQVVCADGSVLRVSEAENADLFWAIRGAGANFGIVTSFEFEVDAVPGVGWAQLVFDASETATFLRRFGHAVAAASRDTTPFLILASPRGGQPAVGQVLAMVDSTDEDLIVEQLEPLAQLGPLLEQQVVLAPYSAVMEMAPDTQHSGQGEPAMRSLLVDEISAQFAADVTQALHSRAVPVFQFRSVDGAVADVDPQATAYAFRDAAFSVTAIGSNAQRMDQAMANLNQHRAGLYLSFETDQSPQRLTEAFPPSTLARLRTLKRRYDPDNLFRDNFNIPPAPEGSAPQDLENPR